MWSMFSILFMIAGIALLAWHYAVYHGKEKPLVPPEKDLAAAIVVTPSMRATAKYFWLVMGLFLVQILLGRSEEHTSELQSLMRISYAVFCLKKNNIQAKKDNLKND